MSFTLDSESTHISAATLSNAFGNLYHASDVFRNMVDFLNSKGVSVYIGLTDSAGIQEPQTGNNDDPNYPQYDILINIPTHAFDGDTYDKESGGTYKLTLERILAHEVSHAVQRVSDLTPAEEADQEEQATDIADDVMEDPDYNEPRRGKYYNTEGDDTSGVTTNKDSGDDPEDNIHDPSPAAPVPGVAVREKDTDMEPARDKVSEGEQEASPLVFDLDDSGTIDLVSLANSDVMWDLDEDGFRELSGWVSASDGLLAIDLDQNGRIDDNGELFGSADTDGFSQLSVYDSNSDGIIDAYDSAFSDLLIWQDANSDGVSQASELKSLAEWDIISIDLAATEVQSTNQGHSISHTSTFVVDDGVNPADTRIVHDVWFQYDNFYSVYSGDYDLDLDALLIGVNQRGYGVLSDLHISMSEDSSGAGSLRSLVLDFSDLTLSQMFADDDSVMDDVRDIMYRWANVDGVDSESRGNYVNAQELEFMEAFVGEDFLQRGIHSNPGGWAAEDIGEAFSIAQNNIYARLVAQGAGADLFTGTIHYDVSADSLEGVTGLNQSTIDTLETQGMSQTNVDVFWQNVVRVIEYTVGVSNLSTGDQTYLDDAIYATDNTLSLSGIVADLAYESVLGTTYNGTSSGESLTGGSGHDELNGFAGEDVLTGNAGGDYLRGGDGDDQYIWAAGDGSDIIREEGVGTGNDDDRIVLGSGFDSGDLTITRVGNTDLMIDIDNGTDTGQIIIENQFNYASGGGHVELIEFSDSSTYRLDDKNYTLTGTSGADELRGVNTGGADADTIYGGAGNDEIYGYAPNQTSDTATNNLYGEAGDDELYGGIGTDYIYGGADDDYLDGNAGDDVMDGGTGDDYARGDAGDDTYVYTGGHDTYFDNSGSADKITLIAAYDSVTPSYFRFDDDLQIYWDADNTITITNFFTTNSIETMVYDDSTSVTLSSVSAITQGGSGNDTITGTTGDDIFYGNGGDDALNGGSGSNGNDTLYGGTGDDTLRGGYGNDYLVGGAGDDDMQGHGDDDHYVYTSGHDTMKDLSGDDILEFIAGWEYGDLSFSRYTAVDVNDLVIEINAANSITLVNQFYSGNKTETLRMNDGTSDVTLTALNITSYGNSSNNTMNGVVNNASEDDIMYGLAGNDTLRGKDGADTLYGGDGNDTVDGDAGNDILDGGAGDDTYYGDAGDDLFVYTEGLDTMFDNYSGTDTLWLTGGITADDISIADHSSYDAKITINSSVDEIIIDNLRSSAQFHIETIKFDDGFEADLPSYGSWMTGTASNDAMSSSATGHVMLGYGGNDTIQGFGGNDTLYGGAGNDTLEGGDDDDFMHGGIGDDLLYGEDGLDTMFGGAGADTFFLEDTTAFADIDVIKDFDIATDDDVLDISDILDNTSYVHGTDDITDWLEITDSGSDTVVKIDTTGAGSFGVGTQVAKLEGITGLTDEQALVTSGNLIAA